MLNLSEANQIYANSFEDTMTLLTVEVPQTYLW